MNSQQANNQNHNVMKVIIKILLAGSLLLSCRENERDFDATGTFEAQEIIVSAEVTGTIRELDLHEGSQLRNGQVLGWIDSTQLYLRKRQLQAQIDAILSKRPSIATQLASYNVQMETAERELRRVRNLHKAEAATQKQVDDAIAQLDIIRRQMEAHRSALDISSRGLVSETLPLSAQIAQIDDQLLHARIVSPVNGTVLNQYSEAHELVVPGKPLFKIADLSYLHLRAFVTGNQLPDLKLNQPVKVYVDSGTHAYREYEGTLIWISDKAEFTPKTIQTREERSDLVYATKVRVKNDGFLKIGMYGEVKLHEDGNDQ
jgi:HlyD family secretion protein